MCPGVTVKGGWLTVCCRYESEKFTQILEIKGEKCIKPRIKGWLFLHLILKWSKMWHHLTFWPLGAHFDSLYLADEWVQKHLNIVIISILILMIHTVTRCEVWCFWRDPRCWLWSGGLIRAAWVGFLPSSPSPSPSKNLVRSSPELHLHPKDSFISHHKVSQPPGRARHALKTPPPVSSAAPTHCKAGPVHHDHVQGEASQPPL